MLSRRMGTIARAAVPLALGAVAGWLAETAHLPGAWLIGPMLVGIGAGLVGRPPGLPRWSVLGAQGVVGMLVAGSFDPATLPRIAASWPAVLVAVGGTLAVSVAVGIGLARATTLDRATTTLGTLPGGAPAMIALGLALGADVPAVALMQYVRIVVAVLSAALIGRVALWQAGREPTGALGAAGLGGDHSLAVYALTALVAAVGVTVGGRLPIPAGVILCPLALGVAAAQLGLLHPAWPPGVPETAYVLLGLYVGAMFDRVAIRAIRRQVVPMVISILILVGACAGLGGLVARLTGSDYLTGLLATTPGGLDSVTAIGLTSGADVSLMLSIQMVRLFAVVLVGPPLARWLVRRE
jgi:membrane AbrB-like protein